MDYSDEDGWLRFTRGPLTVGLNIGSKPREVSVPGTAGLLLASDEDVSLDGGALKLPPDSVAVLA